MYTYVYQVKSRTLWSFLNLRLNSLRLKNLFHNSSDQYYHSGVEASKNILLLFFDFQHVISWHLLICVFVISDQRCALEELSIIMFFSAKIANLKTLQPEHFSAYYVYHARRIFSWNRDLRHISAYISAVGLCSKVADRLKLSLRHSESDWVKIPTVK